MKSILKGHADYTGDTYPGLYALRTATGLVVVFKTTPSTGMVVYSENHSSFKIGGYFSCWDADRETWHKFQGSVELSN